jgi:hypothetical protein
MIHSPQAVLGKLLDQQWLGIECAVIWKIRSMLMLGPYERPTGSLEPIKQMSPSTDAPA